MPSDQRPIALFLAGFPGDRFSLDPLFCTCKGVELGEMRHGSDRLSVRTFLEKTLAASGRGVFLSVFPLIWRIVELPSFSLILVKKTPREHFEIYDILI